LRCAPNSCMTTGFHWVARLNRRIEVVSDTQQKHKLHNHTHIHSSEPTSRYCFISHMCSGAQSNLRAIVCVPKQFRTHVLQLLYKRKQFYMILWGVSILAIVKHIGIWCRTIANNWQIYDTKDMAMLFFCGQGLRLSPHLAFLPPASTFRQRASAQPSLSPAALSRQGLVLKSARVAPYSRLFQGALFWQLWLNRH